MHTFPSLTKGKAQQPGEQEEGDIKRKENFRALRSFKPDINFVDIKQPVGKKHELRLERNKTHENFT